MDRSIPSSNILNFKMNSSSNRSLSVCEDNHFRSLLPQIIATLIVSSCCISVGTTLVFSAVLIPQLKDSSNTLSVSKRDISWIASVYPLFAPLGSIVSGFLIEKYGRINGLKLAIIPSVLGQITLALASNFFWIVLARGVLGFASLMLWNPSVVYITEITRKDLRGALLSLGPTFVALGMVITYLQGYLLYWRNICWINLLFLIGSFIFLFFIPESPSWLFKKNRSAEAKQALSWLFKYQKERQIEGKSFLEVKYEQMLHEEVEKKITDNKTNIVQKFLKPTTYKPFLILAGLFFFQQFSGIYIVFFYSVNFIQASGTLVNPYLVSVLLGLTRLILSLCNTIVLRKVGRRPLLIFTSLGMSVCMLISGCFSYWLKRGTSSFHVLPTILLLLYIVFAIFGLLTLPWTMNAEMFPLNTRGLAQGLVTGFLHVFMFVCIQNYQDMEDLLSNAGVQWFFGVICLLAVIYIYIFIPETHKKSLLEIENYFLTNTIYPRRKICSRSENIVRIAAESKELVPKV